MDINWALSNRCVVITINFPQFFICIYYCSILICKV